MNRKGGHMGERGSTGREEEVRIRRVEGVREERAERLTDSFENREVQIGGEGDKVVDRGGRVG